MTARVSLNGREHRRPHVCRRLFADEIGPQQESLNDNTSNEIIERLRQEAMEASEKWNFDFINERPLEGNWVWERVAPPDGRPAPEVIGPTLRIANDQDVDSEERLQVSEDAPKSICNTDMEFVDTKQFKTP